MNGWMNERLCLHFYFSSRTLFLASKVTEKIFEIWKLTGKNQDDLLSFSHFQTLSLLSLSFSPSIMHTTLKRSFACSHIHALALTQSLSHSHCAHASTHTLSSLKCLTVFIDFQFLNSVKYHRYLVRQTFIYIGQSKITCLMHFFLQVQSFLEKVTLGKEKFLNVWKSSRKASS